MKPIRLIFVLLWLLALAQMAWYYPQLPDNLASHFDGSGNPNGWSAKADFFALYALIFGMLTLIFMGSPLLFRHLPTKMINLPHRDYWLSPASIQSTIDWISNQIMWLGCAILSFLVAVMHMVFRFNMKQDAQLSSPLLWGLLLAFLAFTILWIVRLHRRFSKRPG